MKDNILEIENLHVRFNTFDGTFSAVNNVSLNLEYSESIGIIGESGCGKSTLAFTVMRYLASNAEVEGAIRFKGDNLLEKSEKDMETVRGNRIAWYSRTHTLLSTLLLPLVFSWMKWECTTRS